MLCILQHSTKDECVFKSGLTLCQVPLSMGFYRHEYWGGLPFPTPGDLPDPGMEPESPVLQVDSLPLSHLGKPPQKDNTHKIHLQDLALDVLWEIFLLSFPWEKQPADTPRKCYTTLWVIWEGDIKTLGKIREPFYLKITLTCWKGQLSSEVITLQRFMLK